MASCNVGVTGTDGRVLAALGIEVGMPRLTAVREKHLVAVLRREATALSQRLQQRGITARSLPQHL